MKIEYVDIDESMFQTKSNHDLFGTPIYLITPNHIGCKWNQKNRIFRSSVWDINGELVSASFPKFVNWGENPENFPLPKSLSNCTCVEKLDGSTLIVSKWNGKYILRTRGTFDAATMEKNGEEVEIFKDTILEKLDIVENNISTWKNSYLFEWVSPKNVIVINYGEPKFYLIGIVSHNDYSLATQKDLDEFANKLGLLRPKTYSFDNIDSLLNDVESWKSLEGVCVYSKNDQEIHKVKSAWYLALHKMKSDLASFEKVLDVWIADGKLNYTDFYNKIETTFDYELAEMVRPSISKILDAYGEYNKIFKHMVYFLEPLKNVSRKEAAMAIQGAYGATVKTSMAFKLLDGKSVDDEFLKKIILQLVK